MGLPNCKKCNNNDNNINYICDECENGYFKNYNEICELCDNDRIIKNNKCIYCNDPNLGIDGCNTCSIKNNIIKCKECKKGFIYDEEENKCLNIFQYENLERLINCKQIKSTKNNECTKCIDNYVLLWEKDSKFPTCVSINFIYSLKNELNSNCQIFKNYGTTEQPKYKCEKCLNDDDENIIYTKINEILLEKSYCEDSKKYDILKNCKEANMDIINKEIIINCIDCAKDYILIKKPNINHFCRHKDSPDACAVDNCKTCKEYDNYFCKECYNPNYEVSPITGSCVKKVPKIPAITWKDIFRFQINQKKIISGREIYGPTLMLLGLTRDEIPQFHALLAFLTFKVKYSNNLRNLEEEIKIPTICEVVNSVEEAVDEINQVEYECIGDISEYEDKKFNFTLDELVNFEENPDDNKNVLRNSNLNEIIKEKNIKNLVSKNSSNFTLKNLEDTSLFIFDEIKNQTSDNLILILA